MEQTMQTAVDSVESGKNYNAHNREDKFYFGGYFNLAQNNISTSLEEIKKRLNLEFDTNTNENELVEFMNNLSAKLNSHLDKEKFMRILKEYFPVADYLGFNPSKPGITIQEEEAMNRKINNFKLLLNAVSELRNFYSHYPDQVVNIDNQTIRILDHVLLHTVLYIKKKKLKTDKTKEAFSDKLNQEWSLLTKEIKNNAKKKYKNENETAPLSVLNRAFSHFLFKDGICDAKKSDAKTNYFSKNSEIIHPLSDAGVVLLLSIFLTTKEYEAFRGNVKGFKATRIDTDEIPTLKRNSFQLMATHWVYTANNYRGLKQPVKTVFNAETLLMQMLDYLSKVPDEVYSHLSKDQQKRYITDLNEFMTSYDEVELNELQEEAINSTTVLRPVIRKRYKDFFNYFALRFLDEFANFPSLRFKVNVGTYVHDVRPKKLGTNNMETNRVLKENIFVFDKLSHVNRIKGSFTEFDSLHTIGWNLFPNPYFAIVNNTIQLAFTDKKKLLFQSKRDSIERKSGKPSPDSILQELYNKNDYHVQAHAVLSLNDLPALLFELLKNPENLIESAKEMENRLYEVAKSQYEQPDLSKTKKGKTLGIGLLKQKLRRDCLLELQKTELKRKLIQQNRLEVSIATKKSDPKIKRKYVFYTSEKGREALWIANDLLRMMPSDVRKDWKGYLHNELQRLLAVFTKNVHQDVKDLFRGYWDIENDEWAGREFMHSLKKLSFDKFYENYLNLREEVIIKLENTATKYNPQNPSHADIWRFFDRKLYYNNHNLTSLEQATKQHPIFLPRGVFDDKPTQIPGKNPDVEADQAEFADWFIYCRDPKHLFQEFYKEEIEWDKAHETYLKNKNSISSATNIIRWDLQKEQEISLKRFIQRSQNAIRKQQQKDLFMWKMVQFIATKLSFTHINDFSLADTYISNEERQKRLEQALKQSEREKGTIAPNLRAQHTFWEQTIPKTVCGGKILVGDCKLKDIGKFNKYEYDKRVKELLEYASEKTSWTKEEIDKELYIGSGSECYESIRTQELLKHIHTFEQEVLYSTTTVFEEGSFPNFRMDVLTYYSKQLTAEEQQLLSDPEFEKISPDALSAGSRIFQQWCLLVICRNKFLHNQFPPKPWFQFAQNFLQKEPQETFARYYCRLVCYLCEEIKREIG